VTERETWNEKLERLQAGPRLRALDERLGRLEAEDAASVRRTLRGLHVLLVDAGLDGDVVTLDAIVDGLQRLAGHLARHEEPSWVRLQGRLDALTEEAVLTLERLPSLRQLVDFQLESQSHRFLHALAEHPGADNERLADLLGARPERVSLLGRQLQQSGLARKRKVGRRNSWDLTPRGTQTLQLIEAEGAPRPQREHRLPALG
jgi:DNA-binding MarR family transcriptional regulator